MIHLTAADCDTAEATEQKLLASFGSAPWAFRHTSDHLYLFDRTRTRVIGPFVPHRTGSSSGLAHTLLAHHLLIHDTKGNRLPFVSDKAHKAAAHVARTLAEASFLPLIDRVVRAPAFVLEQDHLVLRQPGHHGPLLVTTTDAPQPISVQPLADYPHLLRLFSGLHWTDPRHYGNFMGWFLCSFARSAIREFPALVINGTHKSVGKSTVAEAIRILHSQTNAPVLTYTGNEQEFESRLGSFVGDVHGPILIQIDNVRPKQGSTGEIRSQSLSAAATSWTMPARKLYTGPVAVQLPLVLFTMNGARMENDLADKIITVTLTRTSHGKAVTHLDPYPVNYAAQHKYELLSEIWSLLLHTPIIQSRHTRFYTFESVATSLLNRLSLPHEFRPGEIEVTDLFLLELVSVLRSDSFDSLQLGPSYTDIAKEVTSSKHDLPELSAFVRRTSQVSPRAQGHHIRDRVLDDYIDRTFTINGEQITLVHTVDASNVTRLNFQKSLDNPPPQVI